MKIIDLGLAKNLARPGRARDHPGRHVHGQAHVLLARAGRRARRDEPLDHRSDLYSFAAVLYEMVTGLPPFDSENQHGFVFKRLTEQPLPLIGRNPAVRVPRRRSTQVDPARALERTASARFPDALSFLQALVKVAEQLRCARCGDPAEIDARPRRVAVRLRSGRGAGASRRIRRGRCSRPPDRARRAARHRELSREERSSSWRRSSAPRRRSTRLRASPSSRRRRSTPVDRRRRRARRPARGVSSRHASLADLKARIGAARSVAPRRPPRPRQAPSVAPVPQAPTTRAAPRRRLPLQLRLRRRAAPAPAPRPAPPPTAPPPAVARGARRTPRRGGRDAARASTCASASSRWRSFALETLLELRARPPAPRHYERQVARTGREEAALRSGARPRSSRGARRSRTSDLAVAREEARGDRAARTDAASSPTRSAPSSRRPRRERAARPPSIEAPRPARAAARGAPLRGGASASSSGSASSGLAKVRVETYRLRISDIAALAERETKSAGVRAPLPRADPGAATGWRARGRARARRRRSPTARGRRSSSTSSAASRRSTRKQQGIEQGVHQLEIFLDQRKRAEAEMALKILVQMAPERTRSGPLRATRCSALVAARR